MKITKWDRSVAKGWYAVPVIVGLLFAGTAGVVSAQQASGVTRAQVKMERDEFMKSHYYDSTTESWVVKPGFEAPAGVKSRAEVKAERDNFMRNNRWDNVSDSWVPVKKPRDISTLSRAQVRADLQVFMRTHHWDPTTDSWAEHKPRVKK